MMFIRDAIPALFFCFTSLTALSASAPAISKHTLFRSEDQGVSWFRSDHGLNPAARINALAATSLRFFAATDIGMFVSENSGRQWRAAGPLPNRSGRALSVIAHGNAVFVGTEAGGIVESLDEGQSWIRRDGGTNPLMVRSLVRAGADLFAGLDAGGALRSTDNGKTWAPAGTGLPDRAQVFDLAATGEAVFAALYALGLYRFDREHQRWNRIGEVVPLSLAVSAENLSVGHNPGGIFWTGDTGQTWAPAAGDLPYQAPVWAMAGSRDAFIAGAADGIYLSKDGGRSWRRAESGLPTQCPGIAFLIDDRLILAAVIVGE
ncbi:MAG: hypothetical protein IT581_14310 [Verrucomicrobiales bacterium]|nr:hypothetical protein [Verrucomicrobiales bacterium]